ncbi:MAG: RidA family protein [Candidatus Eremiobacteraeota bacterium]|nr:RidA family protein [Candidatus Eremiobacteraeota bacterium]
MSITRLHSGPRMSQATIHAGTVYTAGHVDATGPDVTTQTRGILERLEKLLIEAGSSKSHILSASIWLSDISTFDEMNNVWESWITPATAPARATVQSTLASAEYRVEIALIAALVENR